MPVTWRSGRTTPTALKVLHGSRIRGRQQEPRFPVGRPECPTELQLDPAAAAHWERLAPRLEQAGVLMPAHGEALGLLAQALADYGRVRAQLHQVGYQQLVVDEVRDKAGNVIRRRVKENPLIRRRERLALLVSRPLGEFGLTPGAAVRIQAWPPPADRPRPIDRYIRPCFWTRTWCIFPWFDR